MAARPASSAGTPGAAPLTGGAESRRIAASLLGLAAAATLATACTGERSRGEPRFEATACSLLWYRTRPAGRFDLYKLEMPAATWTTGTHQYDSAGTLGVFYFGLVDADQDGLFEQWQDAASATGGDFALTVEGLDAGDAVGFVDNSFQTYLGVGDVPLAVGGTGGFSGVWSTPLVAEGAAADFAASAQLGLVYAGSAVTLGSGASGAFGYCWDDPAASAVRLWRPDAPRP